MRFFTILSGLVLTSAAALPAAQSSEIGQLVYGDVQLDLITGCQKVPQNAGDGLPKPSSLFTKLQVNTGYACELHHELECNKAAFLTTKGPGTNAEYVSGTLLGIKCSKASSARTRQVHNIPFADYKETSAHAHRVGDVSLPNDDEQNMHNAWE